MDASTPSAELPLPDDVPTLQRMVRELLAEVARLRAENAKLLEQREVLKKSLGILSEAPPRGMPESSR